MPTRLMHKAGQRVARRVSRSHTVQLAQLPFVFHPPTHPPTPLLCPLQAKAGTGSATLSMAQAAARFAEACMRAMSGEPGVVECAYVASSLTDLPYFASPLRLGPAGIEGGHSRAGGRHGQG